MKKKITLLLACSLLALPLSRMSAQVIIGSDSTPKSYSVLELVSQYETLTYGGMRLPQLTTDQRDNTLMKSADFVAYKSTEAKGLMIYNTTTGCVETWSGSNWISVCDPCVGLLAPTGNTTQSFCEGATVANLKATATTGTIKWYNAQNEALETTEVLTNNTTYYAAQVISGCESPKLGVTVTVNPFPAAYTTVTNPQTFCTEGIYYGSSLNPSPGAAITGGTAVWFTSETGNEQVTSLSTLTSKTYYLATKSAAGCYGERVPVSVSVTIPWKPCANAVASDATIQFDAKGVGCIYDARTDGYNATAATGTGYQNTYRVHDFGTGGIWLTENLRYRGEDIGYEGILTPISYYGSYTAANYNYPGANSSETLEQARTRLIDHPEYGLLYSWCSATKTAGTGINPNDDYLTGVSSSEGLLPANYIKSKLQGICPTGWVVPSDWDWTLLEQAITADPMPYSSVTEPGVWGVDEENRTRDAGKSGVGNITARTAMQSTICINGIKSTGKSNIDGTGFNVLLVGITNNHAVYPSNYGEVSYLWTSTKITNNMLGSALNRSFAWPTNVEGSNRYYHATLLMASVRCKKMDCNDLTVADLTPSIASTVTICASSATGADLASFGSDLKWYTTQTGATEVSFTDNIINGTTYYVAKVLNTCETAIEDRKAVKVQLVPETDLVPDVPSIASICASSATGADLASFGSDLKWYTTQTGTTVANTMAGVANNSVYYVAKVIGTCETAVENRKAVTILLGTLRDRENNTYYIRSFGDAGCWMTQNLRSTQYSDGTALTRSKVAAAAATKSVWNPNNATTTFSTTTGITTNPFYGLLYTWAAATNATAAETHASATTAGTVASTVQGICPEGWVLPSDYDYVQLEKAIVASASTYSTATVAAWNSAWPTTSGAETGSTHGRAMKTTTAVNAVVTNGLSRTYSAVAADSRGFDAYLVGKMTGGASSAVNSYGSLGAFWTSSQLTGAANGFYRSLASGTTYTVTRNNIVKYTYHSVRCKMKEYK